MFRNYETMKPKITVNDRRKIQSNPLNIYDAWGKELENMCKMWSKSHNCGSFGCGWLWPKCSGICNSTYGMCVKLNKYKIFEWQTFH